VGIFNTINESYLLFFPAAEHKRSHEFNGVFEYPLIFSLFFFPYQGEKGSPSIPLM